jgi:hypothetical protein
VLSIYSRQREWFASKDFIAENIEAETLARLVRDGQVIRPTRGLYQLPDAQVDAAHDAKTNAS